MAVVISRCNRGTPRGGVFAYRGAVGTAKRGSSGPEGETHKGQGIGEGGRVGIPGRPARHQGPAPQQDAGDHGDPAEEAQQDALQEAGCAEIYTGTCLGCHPRGRTLRG